MRVLAWPADDGGCGAYRVKWAAEALIAQGADVELIPTFAWGPCDVVMQDEEVAGKTVHRAIAIRGQVDADVVVIQRPLASFRADLVPLLQAAGIRVVVEIDDDFSTIHPRNVSFAATSAKANPAFNRDHLARACRAADLVTVTTPRLAERYGGHGRVAVVPNAVPESYLKIAAGAPRLSVGWTGSIQTHPTDLQVTRGAVARAISERTDVEHFRVVGTGHGVAKALGLDAAGIWLESAGWVDLEQYPAAMSMHGVGIVPLDDIAFNQSKSALKLMEYAALGVPVVASPTADNMRMHQAGIGLMAGKPKDWLRHLRALLASADLRSEHSAAGRAIMAGHTIEGRADVWWDAWSTPAERMSRT